VIAEYRPDERREPVELSNGALFAFPVDDVQGFANVSDDDIARVQVSSSRHALRCPRSTSTCCWRR